MSRDICGWHSAGPPGIGWLLSLPQHPGQTPTPTSAVLGWRSPALWYVYCICLSHLALSQETQRGRVIGPKSHSEYTMNKLDSALCFLSAVIGPTQVPEGPSLHSSLLPPGIPVSRLCWRLHELAATPTCWTIPPSVTFWGSPDALHSWFPSPAQDTPLLLHPYACLPSPTPRGPGPGHRQLHWFRKAIIS